jgi:toxin HigB-1
LRKVPLLIRVSFDRWVALVESEGIDEVGKLKSYHDEPLRGDRKGQRSIRLNLAYRAIYEIVDEERVSFLEVQEVSKHDY